MSSTSQREVWFAKCDSVGSVQAQNWIDSQAVKGVELGYVRQWLENLSDKQKQNDYNIEILKIAKKSNTIALLAASASVLSAFAAIIAVYLGSK